jgi:diguanylate cyclase (GGDEF)-like protein/PAS domain S-box-containing protein
VIYLLGVLPLVICFYAFPGHHMLTWTPLGASAVVATLVGVRRHRPERRSAWYLLAAALACFIIGDTSFNVLVDVLGQVDPFPSVADVFYLLMYPLIAVGLLRLVRLGATRHDAPDVLDALTMTTGFGLLSWILVIHPLLQDGELTTLQRLVTVAYPLGDVLVMAMLARLTAGGGPRSSQLLMVGTLGLLAADVGYTWRQLQGTWAVGGAVDLGWVVFYVAWGAAALHPSMRAVSDLTDRPASSTRPAKLALLAGVSLIAPAVLLVEAIQGEVDDAVVIAMFSAALYLLVVARLAGIVRTHQASVRRERILRTSGESLVAARSLDDVRTSVLAAVEALADRFDVLSASLDVALGTALDPADCAVDSCAVDACSVDVCAVDTCSVDAGSVPADDAGQLYRAPLRFDRAVRGFLIVRTRRPMTPDLCGALNTLAAQTALALESATLAEEVRRRQKDDHFKALIQNASDVIVVLSEQGALRYGTPSMERVLGHRAEDLIGTPFETLLHPDDVAVAVAQLRAVLHGAGDVQRVADWRLRHVDGSHRSFEIAFSNLLSEADVGGLVLTMRDVSERRELEGQLAHQAFHDALTGLANRALFRDRVEQALAHLSRRGGWSAMVMLDLDDFKAVNDTFGHAAGDEVLVTASRRLTGCVRQGDTVARLGGDEFAVLMENVHDPGEAEQVATRLVASLSEPFAAVGERVAIGCSAGLVVVAGDGSAAQLPELLKQADLALYAAKERGKGQVVTFAEELHVQVLERLANKSELRAAIDAEQFTLLYQPIVALGTGQVIAAEALVRWRHPDRGVLPPSDFIALAEETGMIVELGRQVIDQAVGEAGTWSVRAGRPIHLSVNVSARQLQAPGFVDGLLSVLTRAGGASPPLIVEITESVLVDRDSPAAEAIDALHAQGVQIAIDDFGVGYSSLGYLQDFPIDILKIDKSFVRNLGRGRRGSELAEAVVAMGRSLRLDVIAEGIEQAEQAEALRAAGCLLGQGYLYSRPMSGADFARALADGGRLGPVPEEEGDGARALAMAMARTRPHSSL